MSVSAIVWMIVVGLIVGIIARFIYPGPVPMNLIWSAILGIAGSFLAGFLGQLIHGQSGAGFPRASFLYSIVGALILIFLARSVFHMV